MDVVLSVWGVAPRVVPRAVARMALDRRHLRGVPGLRFAKLLGTGDGRTFTVRDADPLHWALLTVWDDPPVGAPATAWAAFADGPTYRAWHQLADEELTVHLTPVASRGAWAGQAPFGHPVPTRPGDLAGHPVAAITRARLRASKALSFWRAVPPVSADLHAVPGLRLALGIGEAPIGLQGTFSIWDSHTALTAFAHHRAPHAEAIARTPVERWYTEELFARFVVRRLSGTFRGAEPLVLPGATPPGRARPADGV